MGINAASALKPVQSARALGKSPMGGALTTRQKVSQAIEMFAVLDKSRSGKVSINNFMKIAQVTGLLVDSIELMKYTDERKNTIDYSQLTKELLKQA